MPADYRSTAQALLLSPNPDSPSLRDTTNPPPPWVRPRGASVRRLSTPNRPPKSFGTQVLDLLDGLSRTLFKTFLSLSPLHRLLVLAALCAVFGLGVLLLLYSHRIFSTLGPVIKGWRSLPAGWLIVWLLTFVTAFPPMIGYSTATTVAGFVYGFPLGWPIVATASTAGSFAAFLTSRTVFSGYVNRLVGTDHRFVALGQVLRREGLGMLTMIRFCPLPFSLSNGFLATVPSIRPLSFALSTAFASPKLLVHVFIGSRLALLAEEGDKMSTGAKAINYLSMIIGATMGITVGWLIYKRTMARAAEIALEEAEQGRASGAREHGRDEYADAEAGLLDPEDAAALMVDDDDISLWDTDGGVDAGYRDEDTADHLRHVDSNGSAKPNGHH